MSFKFGVAKAGFKKTGKLDLAVIYSEEPCTYAGVFTKNQVRAACVDVNKKILSSKSKVRAVVINSGNANACTGKRGLLDCASTQKIVADCLSIDSEEVLVSSTGIIGLSLDMKKMKSGIEKATSQMNSKNFSQATKAIMTTDKYEKVEKYTTKSFYINAMAKGAGMIHPNMATMLGYFMTDLKMSQPLLQSALKEAVESSFNIISVDGDTSTNDMVILLSDSSSKKHIKSKNDNEYKKFVKELKRISLKLSKDIVMDGEGATKIFTINVRGVKRKTDGEVIARHLTTSTLLKCAIFGGDPNWGRLIARIGDTPVKVSQDKIDVSINGTRVLKNGTPVKVNSKSLDSTMKKNKEIIFDVNLNLGTASASAIGSDLTHDYVEFNSAYFT